MHKKRHKYNVIFLWMALAGLVACSKVPGDVLSEKEMQAVLVDMQLAEAMISNNYEVYRNDTVKAALYTSVFNKHGITEADYDSSLIWYGRNIDIYMEVYDRALNDLSKRITQLGDVQADAAPTSSSDSINIWPRRKYLTLQPGKVFNGATFEIKPETKYSSGSTFVLGMQIWGLRKQMHFHPEIRLSVDQGDTTLTVNAQITHDGYHETILRSLPTKQVMRVYGFIHMNNADSSYYKVYIDSLSLFKYNYGSGPVDPADLKLATDSLQQSGDSVKKRTDSLPLSNQPK